MSLVTFFFWARITRISRIYFTESALFRVIRAFYSTSAKSNCFFSRLARATLIVIVSPKL